MGFMYKIIHGIFVCIKEEIISVLLGEGKYQCAKDNKRNTYAYIFISHNQVTW